jgi:hypothetical protein
MNLRAKETAQSTVRAINELVGEATDRIEEVLPKVEALPRKLEGVLPGRKKRSHTRRNIGAVLATGLIAAVAFLTLRRKSAASKPAASAYRSTSNDSGRGATDSPLAFDRDREPAGSRN